MKYSIADNASTVKTLAQNTYDFAGRLIRKERGNIRIQTLTTTYDYNILSAVTRIQTGTLFLERLHYGDAPDAYAGYSPKYNGGISSIEWTTDNLTRGYNYTYDSADRLTKAQYRDNQDININNRYTTTYAYDRNGNITKLTRRGKMADGTYDLVDDLTLKYNGNQLTKVTDAVKIATSAGSMDFTDRANVDNEYTYDANGNMTRDLNKGITSITYNVLNLPAKVTFSNGVTVMYTYDANGNKLKTIHKSATKTHTTEYCGNHIYEDGNLTRTLFDGGYITYKGNSQQYHYHITDHQGNIRLVVNASGSTVEQFTHYYPYGLPFAEGKNSTLQPYKYNGKELDTEDGLNLYDYGARHYDAALCRWNAMDALAEKYYNVCPYNYCVGNPIMFVDPDGNSIHWVESKTGNIYWDDNAISESTTKAGEKYLGQEGYGINEITGDAIHYQPDGTTTSFSQSLPEFTTTPSETYMTSNPSYSSKNAQKDAYHWDEKDLAVWRFLQHDNSTISTYVKDQVRNGNFEILSSDNYWSIYGQTAGIWNIINIYYQEIIGIGGGPSIGLIRGRGFALKYVGTNTNNLNVKPTFSEYLHMTKGQYKGIKGRGNAMKAAATDYHKKYGK